MRKLFLILVLISLVLPFQLEAAYKQNFTCTALTGGTVGALDYYKTSGLHEGDETHCFVSGDVLHFRFDVDGTNAENTSTHPYYVRPDDYSTQGVWVEQEAGFYTETDPIVGAVSGIVKADGAGNISAAVADTDYLATHLFQNVFFPDGASTDQGATDATYLTVKEIVDAVGSSEKATIVFRHTGAANTTTYTFATSETITENITVIMEPGAISAGTGDVQLRILGTFYAAREQCFNWDGSSYILFGSNTLANAPFRTSTVYPEWWGAKNDGITDCSNAINKAIISLVYGGTVKLGIGVYYLGTDEIRVAVRGITIEGSGWAWVEAGNDNIIGSGDSDEIVSPANLPNGTWLWVDQDSTGIDAVIEIRTDQVNVKHLGMAWEHNLPDAAGVWAPTAYGPGISYDNGSVSMDDCHIEDVFMLNAVNGVYQTSGVFGRLVIDGLYGQFFNRAVYVFASADVCYYNNIHVWPYWSQHNEVYTYTQNNTVAMELKRADWHKINNIFGYQVLYGIEFDKDADHGEPGKIQVNSVSFDGTLGAGIVFTAALDGGHCIAIINNYTHVGYLSGAVDAVSSSSNGLQVAGSGIDVQINNMYCYLEGAYGLILQGSSNVVHVDNIYVDGFNYANGGFGAIGCDNTATLEMYVGSQRTFKNAQNGAANFIDAGGHIVKDGEGLGTRSGSTASQTGNATLASGTAAADLWIGVYLDTDVGAAGSNGNVVITDTTSTRVAKAQVHQSYIKWASCSLWIKNGNAYTVTYTHGAGTVRTGVNIIPVSHWKHPYN